MDDWLRVDEHTPGAAKVPPVQPSRVPSRFLPGLLLGVLASLVAFALLLLVRASVVAREELPATTAQVVSTTKVATPAVTTVPDAKDLAARWARLRADYIETAAPAIAALDRVESLRAQDPPKPETIAQAEAAYRAAKMAFDVAEEGSKADGVMDQVEEQRIRMGSTAAENNVASIQRRLDDVKKSRDRVIEAWVAKGHTRAKAESGAGALFYQQINKEERLLELAKASAAKAKTDLDRVARFNSTRNSAARNADLEALRSDMLTKQAQFDALKTGAARDPATRPGATLTSDERLLLDLLIDVVNSVGTAPPKDDDPLAFQAFLDDFEARLEQAKAASVPTRPESAAGRYNALVNRLLRAQDSFSGK